MNRTTLDNGLTVLTRELHHAPVTSFWLWYRVGSRNEAPGHTGSSHWVEHMMFKGSARFPKGTLDREIARRGGSFNAMTWLDFTAYYATLPAEQIAFAMRLEADRMTNAAFDPAETEAERTVILSELAMYQNSPGFRLGQAVQAAAFEQHPYHHETIGWEDDLRALTRDALYQHYRTFYSPNNAIAVAVGNFETAAMVDQIAALFGGLPRGPELPALRLTEPPQRAERRITLRGSEPTPLLMMAYKAPAATDADFWPMTLLDTLLGGAKGAAMFGSRGNSRTSRLHRRLVDGNLALGAASSLLPTLDPFLFSVDVTVLPTSDRAEVERAVEAELARLRDEPLAAAELGRAKKQTRARFALGLESMSSQGRWIGLANVVATPDWFDSYLARIEAVSAEEMQAVAQRLLQPARRTVGWYVPDGA